MINRSKLKFHESFQPEQSYISKVLILAAEEFKGSKFDISDSTGIPTGMQKGKVEPSIKYANFMGLIDFSIEKGEYSLKLTPLGNEVYSQDRYLHEKLTIWLCHYGITHPTEGAPQWSYLVHRVHPGYLSKLSSEYLLSQAKKVLNVDISFEELFGVVKRSYLDGYFGSLDFLEWGSGISFREAFENQELIYAYGYAILNSWECLLHDKDEITILELQEIIGFGRTFGLNENETDLVLDVLAGEGLLSLNRQLYPPTIIRTAHANDVIANLYSRLL
jgi:hypothetical protein